MISSLEIINLIAYSQITCTLQICQIQIQIFSSTLSLLTLSALTIFLCDFCSSVSLLIIDMLLNACPEINRVQNKKSMFVSLKLMIGTKETLYQHRRVALLIRTSMTKSCKSFLLMLNWSYQKLIQPAFSSSIYIKIHREGIFISTSKTVSMLHIRE